MAFPGEVGLQLLLSPLNSNIVVRTACCSVGIVIPVYSTFKAIENKDQIAQQRWLLYWAAYGSFSLAEVFADKILSWYGSAQHDSFWDSSMKVSIVLGKSLGDALSWMFSIDLIFILAEIGHFHYLLISVVSLTVALRFPLYHHMKFAFLVWLQLPSANVSFISSFTLWISFPSSMSNILRGKLNENSGFQMKSGAGQLYTHHLRPFLLRHQARLDCFVEFLSGEMNKFVSAHQAEFQFAKSLLMKTLASVNQIARDVIRPGDRQANGTFQGPARRIQDAQSDGED
ncbi:hypothetical protein DKX38_014389 [Salix brachista]|uniref:HVA22-like protein n=1 Tax=Salix brachista TaxID=2182728 RepID=A0A5N5LF49_9ROSI|nr:hypothetical protein DKX38_014389 [Salix brachista]